MRSVWSGLVLASLAAFFMAPRTHAQAPVERHDWFLLVDASGSFKDGGEKDVRNEALVQLQTLLAVESERNVAIRQEHRLKAYRFGTGVQEIGVQEDILKWGNVRANVKWDFQLDRRVFITRSDFIAALKKAKEDIEARPGSTRQHVILISDGDLDVGRDDRKQGALPGLEEIDAYREFLTDPSGLLNWFAAREIKIHTFYVPPDHQRANPSEEEIARRLTSCNRADIAAQAFAMIEELSQQRGCASGVGRSEGAYVMFAIARHTSAQFHQVKDTDFVSTLQKLVMPDLRSDVGVAPGTHHLYLVVRRGDTAELTAKDSQGRPVQVRIPRSGIPDITPRTALTSEKIEGPLSIIYRFTGDLADGGPPSAVQKVSDTGLSLQWVHPARRAPLPVYLGREVTVTLSLRKGDAERTRSITAWREFFRNRQLEVIITVQSSDSNEKPRVEKAERKREISSADSIVDFEHRLSGFARPGRYELHAELRSIGPNESWVQIADDVAEIKAVPVPHLRVVTATETPPPLAEQPVDLKFERSQVVPVAVPAGINLKRWLEIWQPASQAAPDLARLQITLSQMSLQLLGPPGILRPPEIKSDSQRVIWRSDAVKIDSAISNVEIVVDAGAGPLYGALQIPAPPNPPQWTIQSGLMNADGSESCPSRRAQYFHIQEERELPLARGPPTTQAHIAVPQGDLPVCLIFRWKNYESLKGYDWVLEILDGDRTIDARRAVDAAGDPESAAVWKSTPVSVTRAALRGRLATRLRLGDQIYIAQHTIDALPQGEAEPYFCRTGPAGTAPRCQLMEVGKAITVQPPGSDPFTAFFELRMTGVPNSFPEWRIVMMNYAGRFKVKEIDPKKNLSVLQTDSIPFQNVQSQHSARIDQRDYEILIDKGFAWRFVHFLGQCFHFFITLHHSLLFLIAFYPVFTAVIAFLFGTVISTVGLRKSSGHRVTYWAGAKHVVGRVGGWVRHLVTGSGDRFEFRLFQPDKPNGVRFVVPALLRMKTYLVAVNEELKVHESFFSPNGEFIRLFLTNPDSGSPGPRFNLETDSGPWTIREREDGSLGSAIQLASNRPYHRAISRLAGVRLELSAGVEPQPQPTTIQLLGRNRQKMR